jgi:hypothetical protein
MSLSTIDVRYFKLAVGQENIGKENSVDIVARCPVCGDSQKNKNSKRLHLYIKNNETRINCFNGDCEVNNKTTYGFLKSFYPNLLENYKRENFIQNLNTLSGTESEDVFAGIAENINKSTQPPNNQQIKPVVTHNLFKYFENILEHDEALSYLAKRGFDYFNSKFEWYFGKQDLRIGDKLYKLTNSLIIPLYYEEEMYGFYSRNIHNKEFFTYMPEQNIGYKIFNWFQIDKDKQTCIEVKTGKVIQVEKTDPRWKTGEIIGNQKGKKWLKKDGKCTLVHSEKINSYINDGWEFGFINNKGKHKND